MNRIQCAAILTMTGCFSMSNASAGWIDWTSTTTGTMDVGGTSVGVTLTGSVASLVNGDYYYNNSSTGGTSLTGTYGGLAPSDLIRVVQSTILTITFDQAVEDLSMALVSVGQPNYNVTYDFNNDFSVSSYGSNYWGYGGYSINGDDFIGNEFNGVLDFTGEFNSITFSTNPYENWHGFNFASEALASVSEVPEPAPIALLATGLLGLLVAKRKKV